MILSKKNKTHKPSQERVNKYLDGLRLLGVDLFNAKPYILVEFTTLSDSEADNMLIIYMDTFHERHLEKKT